MKKEKTNERPKGLAWPELFTGKLIKRYKRFLADVELQNGNTITAHCPNSGSMKTCSEPGRTVYLSYHDNPRRKLKYTWEIIKMPDSLSGVNTLVPNRLVKKSIQEGQVPELEGYNHIQSEVKVSPGSRLDLLLSKENKNKCYVEVKNCSLVEKGMAYFPDAVTERGRRHLVELQKLLSKGHRCAMFYLIQRMDAIRFSPADHIDPAYGKELRKALKNGVEIIVYDVKIDLEHIFLNNRIPIALSHK